MYIQMLYVAQQILEVKNIKNLKDKIMKKIKNSLKRFGVFYANAMVSYGLTYSTGMRPINLV